MTFSTCPYTSVQLAERLVNTFNLTRGVEKIPDVAALVRLAEQLDIDVTHRLTQQDLEAVRALRPRLRRVFALDDEDEAVADLNGILLDCRATPHVTRHDGRPWHLHVSLPDAPLAEKLGAAAAMGLLTVISENGLSRLHVCNGNRCSEVFVDLSRNQSRRYCSPAICGNRAKVANFRQRHRTRSTSS